MIWFSQVPDALCGSSESGSAPLPRWKIKGSATAEGRPKGAAAKQRTIKPARSIHPMITLPNPFLQAPNRTRNSNPHLN